MFPFLEANREPIQNALQSLSTSNNTDIDLSMLKLGQYVYSNQCSFNLRRTFFLPSLQQENLIEQLVKAIPTNVGKLNLQHNQLNGAKLIEFFTYFPSEVMLHTIDLRNNLLHRQSLPKLKKPLPFRVEYLIFSDNELRRMTKSQLAILSHLIPWGTKVVAFTNNSEPIYSEKINFFKRKVTALHSNEIKFFDTALTYLERKHHAAPDAIGVIASYIHLHGGLNKSFINHEPYSRRFFNRKKLPKLEVQAEIIQHESQEIDLYEVKLEWFVISTILLNISICIYLFRHNNTFDKGNSLKNLPITLFVSFLLGGYIGNLTGFILYVVLTAEFNNPILEKLRLPWQYVSDDCLNRYVKFSQSPHEVGEIHTPLTDSKEHGAFNLAV